ncbi:MAG TPA: response regulator transcription factor [Frankiaceae bacterium]|nr:response regulator transcription factor [Frankiaceae bacterium]
MAAVLLVEDDPAIADPMARALGREGYQVEVRPDGPTGLAAGLSGRFDVVVLDIGLPFMDGLEVCRRLRARLPRLQVLVLTARAEEIDAVDGLDAGADDYVAKPFRLAELLARVRAAVRRVDSRRIAAGGVRVDAGARRAFLRRPGEPGEHELALSGKEFDLLRVLVREAGSVVTREALMREVWGTSWMGSTKTLDQHVSWLRHKLGDDATDPRYITTVRGVGFRFTDADAAP